MHVFICFPFSYGSLKVALVNRMGGAVSYLRGTPGPSGFGSKSTAEDVTAGMDLSSKTIIISGTFLSCSSPIHQSAECASYVFMFWWRPIKCCKVDVPKLGAFLSAPTFSKTCNMQVVGDNYELKSRPYPVAS